MILDKPFPTDLRVENEATSLIKAGHEVGLLSIAPYDKSQIIDHKGIKVYQNAVSTFYSKKMHGLAGMLPWMDWHVTRQVLKIFEEDKYNAIHFHDLYIFGAAKKLKKKLGVKLVGDLHEFYVEVLPDYKWTQTFPNKLFISMSKWKRIEREWLSWMDKIVVVNKEMKEKTISKGVSESNIVIVDNILNTDVFDAFETNQTVLNRFKDTFNLLFVGWFVGNRGLEHVVDAMNELRDYEDIHLILVGDGALKPVLDKKVDEYNLHKTVHLEGWQPQEMVKSYLLAGDVGLIPSIRSPQTDNGSPNKLYQYMYYGLPIITSNCPAKQKIVENEQIGLVYESENVKKFIESVLTLYKNRNLVSELGKNGKKAQKEKYSWEANISGLIDMYNSM